MNRSNPFQTLLAIGLEDIRLLNRKWAREAARPPVRTASARMANAVIALFVIAAHSLPAATMYNVSTAAQLEGALASANRAGGDATIILADGTYTLSDTLQV